jgi:hypothetical protein
VSWLPTGFAHLVTLGDSSGAGMLETAQNIVTTDSRGRYYVSNDVNPYFWVFDTRGKFIQRVSRRGQGPGEFSRVSSIVIGLGDTIFVCDPNTHQLTVFAPDYRPVRRVDLGVAANFQAAVVGQRLIVNANLRTGTRAGYPLHLYQASGQFVRSFGSIAGAYRPDVAFAGRRNVASAGGDAVWSGLVNEYLIERWDTAGRLTISLRRDPDWFKPYDRVETGAAIAPVPLMRSVAQQHDSLWVIAVVADPQWASAVSEATPDRRFFRVSDSHAYQDSYVELIDWRRGELIVSTRSPKEILVFVAPGVAYWRSEDGHLAPGGTE